MMCNGFHGNNFGQPVCSTCHLFLFSADINKEEGEEVYTEVWHYRQNMCSLCYQYCLHAERGHIQIQKYQTWFSLLQASVQAEGSLFLHGIYDFISHEMNCV